MKHMMVRMWCLYECQLFVPFSCILQHMNVTLPFCHNRHQVQQAGIAVVLIQAMESHTDRKITTRIC